MMWMLSASSARRWSTCGDTTGFNVFRAGAVVGIVSIKRKSPGCCPRALDPSAFLALTSGYLSFEQEGRWRGDPEGPGTTAYARPNPLEHQRHQPLDTTVSISYILTR